MTIEYIFNAKIDELLLSNYPKKLAAAVSGGPDSMVMCYLLQKFCIKNNIALHVLIVNHMLRTESSAEAQNVQLFLNNQGIKTKILTWDGKKPSSNIQALAREKRYQLLSDYCKTNNIHHLITGHQADDQAETVLLRIIRGSGIDGIAGMQESSKINNIFILRPMLSIRRSEIMKMIQETQWLYVEDPSNKNSAFSRIKVRNLLSNPEWSFMHNKLQLLGKNATRARNYLQQQTDNFIKNKWTFSELGTASINLHEYITEHEEIALRALSKVLMYIGGNTLPPRLVQIEKIYSDLKTNQWNDRTLFGCILRLRKKQLSIMREYKDIPTYMPVIANKVTVWDNRFIVESDTDGYIQKLSVENINELLKPLIAPNKIPLPYEILMTLPSFFTNQNSIIHVPGLYNNHNHSVSILLKPILLST